MVFLSHDQDLIGLEDLLGPVDALIGRESGMIHKHILRRNTGINCELFHCCDLVVFLTAMVTTHKELWCSTQVVQLYAPRKTVVQHVTGPAIVLYKTAKHQDAVNILQFRSFLGGDDLITGTQFNDRIDYSEGGNTQDAQAQKNT